MGISANCKNAVLHYHLDLDHRTPHQKNLSQCVNHGMHNGDPVGLRGCGLRVRIARVHVDDGECGGS